MSAAASKVFAAMPSVGLILRFDRFFSAPGSGRLTRFERGIIAMWAVPWTIIFVAGTCAGIFDFLPVSTELLSRCDCQRHPDNISPDGRYRLEVHTARKCPTFELDPPGMVWFDVRDIATGTLLTSESYRLWEWDEFTQPVVVWTPTSVTITDFEDYADEDVLALTLR